jgi:chaperone LolA
MFKKSFLCLALCVSSVIAHAEPLAPNDVKTLLGHIREKRASSSQVQADFQEEKTIRMMNKPVVSSGKVWFQPPNKFRREVKGSSPSVTVSDGQQLWIYYPKFQAAENYQLGKRSPLDAFIAVITASLNLQDVEQSYNITAEQTGSSYVLQLRPRAPAVKRVAQQFTVHINEALQVQRVDMMQPNGDRMTTTLSNETRGTIDPATFQFTPPAGTSVTTPLGR